MKNLVPIIVTYAYLLIFGLLSGWISWQYGFSFLVFVLTISVSYLVHWLFVMLDERIFPSPSYIPNPGGTRRTVRIFFTSLTTVVQIFVWALMWTQ